MLNFTYDGGDKSASSTLHLGITCRACGYANLPEANYCDHCASRLKDLAANLGVASRSTSAQVRQSGRQIAGQLQRTSSSAIFCMAAGVLGWTLLPIVGAVVAVVFGRRARREIRESNGTLGGQAFVTIGRSLGMIELGLFVLGLVGSVLVFIITILVPIVLRSMAFN